MTPEPLPPQVPLRDPREIDLLTDYEGNEALRRTVEADARAWTNEVPPDVEYKVEGTVFRLPGTHARGIINAGEVSDGG